MWPFDGAIIDPSPFYNILLGAILVFAGLFSFKAIPGKAIPIIIGFAMLAVGILLITGYLEVW